MEQLLLLVATFSAATKSFADTIKKREEDEKEWQEQRKRKASEWEKKREKESSDFAKKRDEDAMNFETTRKQEEDAWLQAKLENDRDIQKQREKIEKQEKDIQERLKTLEAEQANRPATSSSPSSCSSPFYSASASASPASSAASSPAPEPRPNVQAEQQYEDIDFGDNFLPVQVVTAPVQSDVPVRPATIADLDAALAQAIAAPLPVSQSASKQILTKDDAREALKTTKPGKNGFLDIFLMCMNFLTNDSFTLERKPNGDDFTFNKWKVPTLIETAEKLGIKIKEGISFQSLRKYDIQSMTVIKSFSAGDPLNMSLKKFLDLLEQGAADGLNILSFTMETISAELANAFEVPKLVFENSWVDKMVNNLQEKIATLENMVQMNGSTRKLKAEKKWLENLLAKLPTLEKFLLLSAKGSFTDIHVDMAATSVFYHVIVGKKIFFVAEPNEENMKLYLESECGKDDDVWLGSKLFDKFQKVEINAGETAFIPAGWIHFVYTPVDSIVFGGNFLYDEAAEIQMRFGELERQLVAKRIMKSANAFTNFEHTMFAYADTVLLGALETKSTTLEVGGEILAGLRRMIQRRVRAKGSQAWRCAVVKKLEETLANSARAINIDPDEFLKTYEPKEYVFEFPEREERKNRKRARPSLSATSPSAKRKNTSPVASNPGVWTRSMAKTAALIAPIPPTQSSTSTSSTDRKSPRDARLRQSVKKPVPYQCPTRPRKNVKM